LNKLQIQRSGCLLVTLNQEDNANPSKSKTFHEHFGEKWLQQWRERWEKAPPWMSVLRMGGRREEGGGRRKEGFVLYTSLLAQAKSW
jgi:hypothetical protein